MYVLLRQRELMVKVRERSVLWLKDSRVGGRRNARSLEATTLHPLKE